jgi:thymidine phosphorylase
MSKKLALGASTLILDVKWGSGAFRTTVSEALELAAALRRVARDSGVACEALITDMNQPLGPALGTANEVRAARDVLSGGGDDRLREVTLRLCRQAMVLRGADPADAEARLESSLASGAALDTWDRMVAAHGGDPDPQRLPVPDRVREVTSATDGTVTEIAAASLGRIAAAAGAGRRKRDDVLDFGGGVTVHVRLGDRVEAGQPVASLELGERTVDDDDLVRRLEAAFVIGPGPDSGRELVLGTVDEVDTALADDD